MNRALEVMSISKQFSGRKVIEDLTFHLEKGEIGCLLGESGCGKTTALRCVAGFESPDAGRIRVGDRVVAGSGRPVPAEDRRVGMIFQDYALFPHLSVRENILFGLSGLPKKEQERRLAEMLELSGLAAEAKKYPHELSGGQQQRVALSRSLAPKPDLLLMDEPFSNLDVALRERISIEVREIIKKTGITALLVTHNQQEAFSMADTIGVMRNGKIAQWDSAYNLYHRPRSQYVADFLGEGALIRGKVVAPNTVQTVLGTLEGHFAWPCRDGCPTRVLIRPEDIVVSEGQGACRATVVRKDFRGAATLYTLRLPSGERIPALVSSHQDYPVGAPMDIVPRLDEIVLFETGSEEKR